MVTTAGLFLYEKGDMKMIVRTKYFGEVDVDETRTVKFTHGLLGLEDYKTYVIFEAPGNEALVCLQCLDEPRIAFMAVNPWDFFEDYDIQISDEELAIIGIAKIEQLIVFNILTIGDGSNITANLLAPVVINAGTRDAMQIVLNEDKYTTKHTLPGQKEV